MENSGKKPRLALLDGQLKQEAVDHGTSRAVMVADPTPLVTKMAIETDKSLYDCQLCYLPLEPPVLKCLVGHGVCRSCADNNSGKCHWCEDGTEYKHMLLLDPYVMAAKVPCPNVAFGCQSSVTYCRVKDHWMECPHAPCHCPEPGCAFDGSPLMLYDHLKAHHDWLVTSIVFDKTLDLQIHEAVPSEEAAMAVGGRHLPAHLPLEEGSLSVFASPGTSFKQLSAMLLLLMQPYPGMIN